MRALRMIAELRVADLEAARGSCTGYLGLSTEEFNLGWVARYTSLGNELVHPLTDEPRGVRRSFVCAPDGTVINILRSPRLRAEGG